MCFVKCRIILFLLPNKTESVAQLVRATVCGTVGRGFETHRSPNPPSLKGGFYFENLIMYTWYYLLPILTAFIGWCINCILLIYFFRPYQPKKIIFFSIQGILPAKREKITDSLAEYIVQQLPIEELFKKITSEESIATVLPLAENAIDVFLRKKLVGKMPMLSMFVSDRLINDLKIIFIEELTTLLPAMITQYLEQFNNKVQLISFLKNYLNKVDNQTIEILIRKNTLLIKAFQWWGLIGGFLIGCIQILFLYGFSSVY